MPGLRGLDATPEESAEMAMMLSRFERIEREVANLPDAIRTVARSEDEHLIGVVVSHVIRMIERVEQGRDPPGFHPKPDAGHIFRAR